MNSLVDMPALMAACGAARAAGWRWWAPVRATRTAGDLEPTGWYPVATLLELLRELARKGGHASLVQMGRQLFRDSHQKRLTPNLTSAGDVLFGIDSMYHHANRGQDIGGWEVLRFGPGQAVLRKTTPHHCALEEGILHEALHLVGTDALVVQNACVQAGAPHCELEIRSSVRDQRWLGTHAPR